MVWNYSFGVMGRLRITPLFLHLNHRYDELNACLPFCVAVFLSCSRIKDIKTNLNEA